MAVIVIFIHIKTNFFAKRFYMNENYDDCHHRKTTRTFLYTQKAKKLRKVLYTKSHTLFKKLDNFRYVFIYKKPYTLRYGIFHEIFEVGIYIQKA